MQFLLLFISILPFFEIRDTIYSYAISGRIYSNFQIPFNYAIKSFTFSNKPVFSNLLIFEGYNISSPSISGTSPEENLLLFDGIPLINPMLGYQELSMIPKSFIEMLEILHSSSPLNGLAGIGGAINLIPSNEPLKLQFSSLRKAINLGSGHNKGFTLTFFYESFVDSFPVKYEDIDLWIKNTHDEKFGLFSKFQNGNILFIKRKAGAPGPLGSLSKGERYEFLTGTNFNFLLKNFNLELSSTYTSQTYNSSGISDLHKTLFLRGVIKGRNLEAGTHVYGANSTKIGKRIISEVFGKILFTRKLNKKCELLATLNLNYNYTFKAISPNIAISLSNKINYNLYNFLTISLNHRNPTLNELYWPEDNFARGNPELTPESSLNLDAGLRKITPNYYINLYSFLKKIKDGILWIQEDKYLPKNFALLVHQGAGLEAVLKPGKGPFYVEFDLNLQKSRLNETPFLYRPTLTLNSTIGVGIVNVELSYIGKRPERVNSPKMLPPIYLINLSISKNVVFGDKELFVRGGTENLLDINYEIIRGFPNPGREIFFEITIKRRT